MSCLQPRRGFARGLRFGAEAKVLHYYDRGTNSLIVWDVATRSVTMSLPLPEALKPNIGEGWAISPDGQRVGVVTRADLSVFSVSQPDSATKVLNFPANLRPGGSVVSFSPDSKRMIAGGFSEDTGNNVLYVVTIGQ